MKAETRQLRQLLADLGVKADRVRTDQMLHGTTATIFTPAHVETVADRAEQIVEAGYAVVIDRYADGCPCMARITTDPRRRGVTETRDGSHYCAAMTGGAS